MMISPIIIARLAIVLFNTMVLASYFVNLDISSHILTVTLIALLIFCFIAFILFKSKTAAAEIVHNLQLSIFIVLLFFCVLELAARISPSIIPAGIKNYLKSEDRQATKVEYLDRNPYVIVKPDVLVRSTGYRGLDNQFTYEWKTDKRGFKNLPELVEIKKYKAVAVGDSFTECMGVATNKTWPSLLSRYGYPTYNLGVQSYAPSQFEGVFRLYGSQFKTEYVIIGYTGGIYIRESIMWGAESLADRNAVRQFVRSRPDTYLIAEIRRQATYVPSAIYLLIRSNLVAIMYDLIDMGRSQTPPEFDRRFIPYEKEILAVGSSNDLKRISDIDTYRKEWEKTLSSFLKIQEMSSRIGAKTIIIYFPHRGETYYEKAMKKRLPDIYFEKHERDLIKNFAEKHGIIFIDVSPAVIAYVNRLGSDVPFQKYPYLEIDGHMSETGQAIVAQEIRRFFERTSSEESN
jgi:hypothetical protein